MIAENSPTRATRRSRSPQRQRRSRSRSPIRKSRGNGPRDVRGQECRVYVSNLNYDVKWMQLKDVMKKHGNVEHVEIFTDNQGRSKGSGIVEYSQAEDAARAIKELDGSDFQGRKIRLREDQMGNEEYTDQLRTMKEKSKALKEQQTRGGPPMGGAGPAGYGRGGPPPPGAGGAGGIGALLGGGHQQLIQLLNSKGGDPINSSVFISNLDYETSWQKVKDMLRRAGNCTRCDIAQDDDKRSKGFGSAQFETPFEALTAIAMFNGMEMGSRGRKMSVRLDRAAALHQVLEQLGVPSNEVTEKTIQQLQSIATLSTLTGSAGGLGGLGALGQLTALASGNLSSPSTSALSQLVGLSPQLGGALGGLQTLLAGGLGSTLTSLAGASAAPQPSVPAYQAAPAGGTVGMSYYGGSSGIGGGYGGSSDRGSSSRRDSGVGGGYGGSSGYGSSRGGDSGGRGGGGGGRDGPAAPGCRVFVRNLPFSTKWQELKDKFRDAGHVSRVDIKTNEDGRSKGFGTVTFESPEDAKRAVAQFNGMRLDGREVEVKIDQMNH